MKWIDGALNWQYIIELLEALWKATELQWNQIAWLAPVIEKKKRMIEWILHFLCIKMGQ